MAGLPRQDSASLSEAGQQGSYLGGTNAQAPHSAQVASVMPGMPLHLQGMWTMSMGPIVPVQVIRSFPFRSPNLDCISFPMHPWLLAHLLSAASRACEAGQ